MKGWGGESVHWTRLLDCASLRLLLYLHDGDYHATMSSLHLCCVQINDAMTLLDAANPPTGGSLYESRDHDQAATSNPRWSPAEPFDGVGVAMSSIVPINPLAVRVPGPRVRGPRVRICNLQSTLQPPCLTTNVSAGCMSQEVARPRSPRKQGTGIFTTEGEPTDAGARGRGIEDGMDSADLPGMEQERAHSIEEVLLNPNEELRIAVTYVPQAAPASHQRPSPHQVMQ